MARYHIAVDYGTRAGNLGSWEGEVSAPNLTAAHDAGLTRLRRGRPTVARIFTCTTTPIKEA